MKLLIFFMKIKKVLINEFNMYLLKYTKPLFIIKSLNQKFILKSILPYTKKKNCEETNIFFNHIKISLFFCYLNIFES